MPPTTTNKTTDKTTTKTSTTHGPRDERGVLAGRILDEARTSFAEHGYAGTTIRAVARAADVDPALVYHYYGSKEELLEAATTLPQTFFDEIVSAWATPPDRAGEALVRRMLGNWQNPLHGQILRAVMQISGNVDSTRAKLAGIIANSIMGPAAQTLDEDERALRSSLVSSQLMGLAFMRFVWKIEPIASLSDDALVALIGPTVQRYVDGELETTERSRS